MTTVQLSNFDHRAILVSVNQTIYNLSVYDASRYAWKLSMARAEKAEVVLAVEKGIIIGAFVPEKWMEATTANFPGQTELPGRLGFVGSEAPSDIQDRYLGRGVPEEFRFGSGNPIRYTFK